MGREGVGSGQGRGQEQAEIRIPVSAFHYNNSGSAAKNGPSVLADAAELLVLWQRIQRGKAVIFLDVGIPVVHSMCIVFLRCCSTAGLHRELLQRPLGFPDSISHWELGVRPRPPRSWDALCSSLCW